MKQGFRQSQITAFHLARHHLLAQIMPRLGKQMKKYLALCWSIQMFRPALVEGLICYSPEHNKKATFVRVEHWLPQQKEAAPLAAQLILLRR